MEYNIKLKTNKLTNDLSDLNQFILKTEEILKNNQTSWQGLFGEIQTICQGALSDSLIEHTFIDIEQGDSLVYHKIFPVSDSLSLESPTSSHLPLNQTMLYDTVVSIAGTYYNRTFLVSKIDDDKHIVVGYDVNLYKYWQFFSKYHQPEGSYTVLTNRKGVCLLHPDKVLIGSYLEKYFSQKSTSSILRNSTNFEVDMLSQAMTKSMYLGVDVYRFYDVIKIKDIEYIVVINIPVTLLFKDQLNGIRNYFIWISIFAFTAFLVLLGISRLQQQREYQKHIKAQKEKQQLILVNEVYQQKNAVLQLSQLQKKMNPHFLYNSLNSLVNLIEIDQDLAQKFVIELSEVYRYLLEDKNENLTTLKNELNFLERYCFLQGIRFKSSLKVNVFYQCQSKPLQKYLPVLSLETLVENAIKHNKITKQTPLNIEVIVKDDQVIVRNNHNPKVNNDREKTKIGLNYLKNCYQFYNISTFSAGVVKDFFVCHLPLLLKR